MDIKGSRDPIGVLALEGVGTLRTSYEIAQSRGLSRMVGRRDELAALRAALEQALEGNTQVVGVVGEAGVGKSRLCEEFARLARPLDQVRVPPTVQAVLAARIDRLGERDKDVLQTAAVIGREFREPVLQHVCERPDHDLASALRSLCASEFLRQESLYPVAEYRFWHPLTQEVALASLLSERRAALHGAVARARSSSSSRNGTRSWPGSSPTTSRRPVSRWRRVGGTLAPRRVSPRVTPRPPSSGGGECSSWPGCCPSRARRSGCVSAPWRSCFGWGTHWHVLR